MFGSKYQEMRTYIFLLSLLFIPFSLFGADADMVRAIEATAEDGLNPQYYHHLNDTDVYIAIANHYKYGVLDPYTFAKNPIKDKAIIEPLREYLPKDGRYLALKKAYAEYKKLYEGVVWPKIPRGEKIKEGDSDPRVPLLRERLSIKGKGDVFEPALTKALMEFQKANGLLDDGVLGNYTVDQLNISSGDRISQIAANLDRLRGLLPDLRESRYIVVNVPDFYARLYDGTKIVWESRAITGRVDRKTPLMKDQIEFLVFSPKWRVPTKIAVEDKAPEMIKDPSFIKKHGMKVFEMVEGEAQEVDPETIDWTQVTEENFQYRIVQDPGDDNALGRIKFMFPNKYDVYLHDTPSKKLFESMTRSFSSGCIRIQRPAELAEYLLKDKENWGGERIEKEMQRNSELFVNLSEFIPIRIVYLTSWVADDGKLQFRRDLYGYDKKYKKLLK